METIRVNNEDQISKISSLMRHYETAKTSEKVYNMADQMVAEGSKFQFDKGKECFEVILDKHFDLVAFKVGFDCCDTFQYFVSETALIENKLNLSEIDYQKHINTTIRHLEDLIPIGDKLYTIGFMPVIIERDTNNLITSVKYVSDVAGDHNNKFLEGVDSIG